MNHKILTALALVSSLAFAACTSSSSEDPKTADPNAVTTAGTSVDAKVTRIVHLPDGKVVGVALSTGVTVRFPPHAGTEALAQLEVGDAVHVEADKNPHGHGNGLVARSITKGGTTLVARPEKANDARGEHGRGEHGRGEHGRGEHGRGEHGAGPMMGHGHGPMGHGPMGHMPPPPDGAAGDRKSPFEGLAAVTRSGKVVEVDADPRGRAHVVTLEDGTTAYLPPFAKASVAVGDVVAVSGKGGEYKGGAALAVEKMKVGASAEVTFAPPAPPAKVQRDGTIERVLTNPHGDVDGFLLDDGTVVMTGPVTSSPVAAGNKVSLEGHAMGGAFFARSVSVDGKAIDLQALRPEQKARPDGHAKSDGKRGEPGERGHHGPRMEGLSELTRTAKVRAVVAGPDGDVHRLVLADGTSVMIPPFAGDTSALAVGKEVTVKGRGTEGKAGTSIFAQTVSVDGKEIVTMKEHAPRAR